MPNRVRDVEVVALLEVVGVSKRVGDFRIKNVNLKVGSGEYFVLLGPNGAGKTLLLELIAGIRRHDEGRIYIGGRDVSDLPPERRNVGYVPQNYALFPHMSVRENLEFGLRMRGMPLENADRIARALGITHLLERKPTSLSGGERQRVALARALAIEPEVMLLDEPLSNVDPHARFRLMEEMRRWHSELEFTAVHVTHSFEEAFKLADRIGIMMDGEIVQTGSVEEILRPRDRRVAEFLGFNVLDGRVVGRRGTIAVRPDDVVVGGDLEAEVLSVDWTGYAFRVKLGVDGKEVTAIMSERPKSGKIKITFRKFFEI